VNAGALPLIAVVWCVLQYWTNGFITQCPVQALRTVAVLVGHRGGLWITVRHYHLYYRCVETVRVTTGCYYRVPVPYGLWITVTHYILPACHTIYHWRLLPAVTYDATPRHVGDTRLF